MKVRIFRVQTNETIIYISNTSILEVSKWLNRWYGEDNASVDFEIVESEENNGRKE